MAEIRSVSVHLDADVASYIAKMRLAGAATDAAFGRSGAGIQSTNTKLTTTERQLGKVDTAVRRLGSDMDDTRVKVDTGARSIDRYSGRLGVFADLILGLGPGLIPVLAEAVPLTAAISSNLVFAGAGLGVAKLGLLGVGDALKAVNKAAVEPTAENLQAAEAALQGLSPSARDFVLQLQGLKPIGLELRNIAAEGFLPGVGQGLDSLLKDLPIFRSGIRGISSELGILARDAGDALSSDQWQPFLKFVSDEAPTGLAVMGRSLGHVVHGAAELLMSFQPLTEDIDRGILRVAEDFDRWATSLGKTRGFQDFMAYLRENGPRVVDLLDNTATAFIDISRAAAPLGGPVLDTLNLFLRVIDAIARSDFGTPLFTGLVAFRLLTRATQLWSTVSTSGIGKFVAGQRAAVLAIRQTSAAQQAGVASASELAAAQTRSAAGWATLRGGALKGGAALAGVGLIASGATDKLNLTNTATLAIAGSMFGPWGTAIGAGAGLLLDFTHKQDDSAAATVDFTQTLNQQTGAITQSTQALAAQTLQQDGAFDLAEKLGISERTVTQAALGHAAAQEKLQAQLDHFTGKTQPGYIAGGRGMYSIDQAQALAAGQLGEEVGKVNGKVKGSQEDFAQLSRALGRNVDVTHDTSRAHKLLQRDLQGERRAAQEAVSKWSLFDDTLNDADKSLGQFIQHMLNRAKALEQFGESARKAARRGLDQGLIKSLRDMGEEGALRLKQLANSSDEQIGRANHAFRSFEGAVDDSKNALTQATSRQWLMKVQTAQAMAALRALSAQLNAIHDKTIRITTVHATGGRVLAGDAEGGTVPGPRTPYGDKVLRFLAPGEEVISNRYGQADRNRPLLKAINSGRMADGGTVETHVTRGSPTIFAGDSGLGAAAKGTTKHLKGLQGALRESTKELEAERQHRQNLAQQRQELASSVQTGFMSELFPTDSGIWGTADPRTILRNDIRNARLYRRDIRSLRRRGLSAQVLGTLDTLDEAQAASGMSRHELREISRLYRVRQRAARAAGSIAGNAAYGEQLAESNHHLRNLQQEVHRLRLEVKHQTGENKKNAERTGDHVGDKLNGAARTARRRGRPGT